MRVGSIKTERCDMKIILTDAYWDDRTEGEDVEVHLEDFDPDMYGERTRIAFYLPGKDNPMVYVSEDGICELGKMIAVAEQMSELKRLKRDDEAD